MKKIILATLIFFLTFIIYKINDKNLIDYLSIGDSLDVGINSYGNNTYSYNDYIKNYLFDNDLLHKTNFNFSKVNYRTSELLNDLINDKEILYDDKSYNLKKELREADLITIAIGMDELINIIKEDSNYHEQEKIYSNLDIIISNMDKIITNIVKLSKGKIVLVGYYNPYNNYIKELNEIFAYIDDKYLEIAKKYNIEYVDIYNLIKQNKDYLPNNKDYHITSKAYLKIANKIIQETDIS